MIWSKHSYRSVAGRIAEGLESGSIVLGDGHPQGVRGDNPLSPKWVFNRRNGLALARKVDPGSAQDDHDLARKRSQAESWVDDYAAIAAATVVATTWIPGAASGILSTLEATMCYEIGKIYKQGLTTADASAAARAIGLAPVAGQVAALEAAILTGPFALAIKPAIASGIVKVMGQLVIHHFEEIS